MSVIPPEKSISKSILDAFGGFFGNLFDYSLSIFDLLEKTFDVIEKAFDNLPLIGPLIALAITGMIVYYFGFFQSFNTSDMLLFAYFFVGGFALLAFFILYKFAETSEPYLLYRAATRKEREENQKILETHKIVREIVKDKSEHKEITANDVLVTASDKKMNP
jgi:hypothetical protein